MGQLNVPENDGDRSIFSKHSAVGLLAVRLDLAKLRPKNCKRKAYF